MDAAAHRPRGLGDRRHAPAGRPADHHLIGRRLRSPHRRRRCGHRLPQQLLPRRPRGRAGGPDGRPLLAGAVGVPDRRRPAPHRSAVGRHDGARRRRRRGRDRPAAEGPMALQPRARTGAAAAVRRQPGIGRPVRDSRPHGRQRAARHRQDDDAARHPRRQRRRARTTPRLLAAPRARLHGDHAPVVVQRRILAHDPPAAPGAHRIRDGRRLGEQRRRREHQRRDPRPRGDRRPVEGRRRLLRGYRLRDPGDRRRRCRRGGDAGRSRANRRSRRIRPEGLGAGRRPTGQQTEPGRLPVGVLVRRRGPAHEAARPGSCPAHADAFESVAGWDGAAHRLVAGAGGLPPGRAARR